MNTQSAVSSMNESVTQPQTEPAAPLWLTSLVADEIPPTIQPDFFGPVQPDMFTDVT